MEGKNQNEPETARKPVYVVEIWESDLEEPELISRYTLDEFGAINGKLYERLCLGVEARIRVI